MDAPTLPQDAVERLGPLDMGAVMALEKLCFAYQWTEAQFRLGLERGAYHILGIKRAGGLLAYVAFSVIKDEMEILNLAVHPEHRRQGLGEKLLAVTVEHCAALGVRRGYLDVKRSNTAAIDLYRKFGFNQTGVRAKYYPDDGEDALLFEREF
jgi:ribosomal-protein-alanine N-acetyltransferase